MLFICYPKCSTCKKAKKWLDEHHLNYTERHIVEENPSYDELKEWVSKSGLPLKKFFNTSGLLYKEMLSLIHICIRAKITTEYRRFKMVLQTSWIA